MAIKEQSEFKRFRRHLCRFCWGRGYILTYRKIFEDNGTLVYRVCPKCRAMGYVGKLNKKGVIK